ncbi:MAG TPA: SRPBCC family protein [Nocardioidaceae bacterium]|nr:SRPBCC family protein [Nocardioidaceae bacterium]
MELQHSFTVPSSPTDTWEAFTDVASVAGCFPGAEVTQTDGTEFEGTCKVKLGPIALVYSGTGRFVEQDPEQGRFVIEAKGKDKRGNGTAGATVTATLTPVSSGTAVAVVTDLQITGKPAQFGRGVIQDVSDKLLQQFVSCLEQRLTPPETAPHEPEPEAPPPVVGAPPPLAEADDDALDLGGALLPVLVKNYGKQALAVLVALLVVLRAVRRRR